MKAERTAETAPPREPVDRASGAFAGGVLVSVCAVVVVGVVNYLTRRLLAVRLDPVAYGFFYSAFALASCCVTLVGTGLGQATAVLVSKHVRLGDRDRARSIFGHILTVRIVGGALLGMGLMLASGPLLERYFAFPGGQAAFLLICLFVPLSAAFGGVQSVLNALMDFKVYSVLDIAQYAIVLAVAWLTIDRYGVAGPAAAIAVSHALMLPVALVYVGRQHRMIALEGLFARDIMQEAWRFSRWTVVSVTGLYLMSTLDTLMLTKLRGLESVALYNIALPVVQIFLVILVVPAVFIPVASDLWHGGRLEEMRRICALVFRSTVVYGWGLLIFLTAASPAAIRLLFGSAFTGAARPLLILGVGVPLMTLAQFLTNALSAMGRPRLVAVLATAAVVLNIALNSVLISCLGVSGAALATVVAYGFLVLAAYAAVRDSIALTLFDRATLQVSAAGSVGCLLAWRLVGAGATTGQQAGAGLALLLLYMAASYRVVLNIWREGIRLLSLRGRTSS